MNVPTDWEKKWDERLGNLQTIPEFRHELEMLKALSKTILKQEVEKAYAKGLQDGKETTT